MILGKYSIPESRLIPSVMEDIRKVYDATKKEPISAVDMSKLLGYKTHTTSAFYRRLKAMQDYGLIEGRGKFTLTSLCQKLLFPESPEQEKNAKQEAILHVSLWSELFDRVKKDPKPDSFWIQLKNITGIDASEAQKNQDQIRKWYLEDMSLVSDYAETTSTQSEELRSLKPENMQMSQQMVTLPDSEIIQFDKVVLTLPKKDLKKQWEKLQKYMKIYLEDYEFEEKSEPVQKTDINANNEPAE